MEILIKKIKESISWWDLYVLDLEILLAILILIFFIFGIFIKKRSILLNFLIFFTSLLLLYVFLTLPNENDYFYAYNFNFSKVLFFQIIKFIILGVFLIILVVSKSYLKIKKEIRIMELFLLFLLNLLGSFLTLSAEDFFILYLSIELQSLCVYILIGMNLKSIKSREAGVKYFIQSSVVSAILLLGISFLYGISGTLNFYNLNLLYYDFLGEYKEILFLAITCILVIFLFKLGLVPFHMWLPDVYEGSSLLVMFFLITIPKLIFVFTLIKIFFLSLNFFMLYFVNLFLIIGILSIFIGTFGAIYQIKIKRLIAYSTISHMGFIIISFSLNTPFGYFALFFYLFTYILILISFFIFLLSIKKRSSFLSLKYIYELKYLKESNSFLAYLIMIVFFSNAGIPPFLGFFSKCFVFLALINQKYYFICFFIIVLSIVSTVYYIRLVRFLFFDPNKYFGFFIPISLINKILFILFVFLNFLFCIWPMPFVSGILKLVSLLYF